MTSTSYIWRHVTSRYVWCQVWILLCFWLESYRGGRNILPSVTEPQKTLVVIGLNVVSDTPSLAFSLITRNVAVILAW